MAEEAATSFWRLALKRTKPLVTLNAGELSPPVYCVHPVSGDIIGLREFASLLGCQRVVGIQVPKENMNGAFVSSIEAIAARYVALIGEAQPEGKIILAGWSAGAIIALEMAQQFRGAGRDISLLIALDGAPCNTGAGISPWNPLYVLKLVVNLPRWLKDERPEDWTPAAVAKRLEGKVAYRFGAKVSAAFRNRDTLDAKTMNDVESKPGWSADQKCFMHAMRKSMLAYKPCNYDGKVIVYETRTQPLYHLRQISAAWKSIARLAEVVKLDGSHKNLVAQPIIAMIAEDLLKRLSSADDRLQQVQALQALKTDAAAAWLDGTPRHATSAN